MRTRLSIPPLLLLVTTLAAALLIPSLFMDGMFMDGLLYTCVGKNLAHGNGTFWDPTFSQTYMQSYHEQPPLMFGLLSVFFRVLGDGVYTERIYCLFMCIACFLAFRMLWHTLFADDETARKQFWLPVFFFFCSPVTFWAYTNNVEEATMVVFALLSVAFQLRGIRSEGNGAKWFLLGGIAVTLSTLCKGLQGGFPIIMPITWFIIVRSVTFRKAFFANVLVVLVPVVFYVFVALYEPARNSYLSYFHDRIEATFLVKQAATTSSHFFLLFELLLNLLPALVVGTVIAVTVRRFTSSLVRKAIFFAVLGLSGILPLMVTLEQRGFYLVTGLPFIAIALAIPLTTSAAVLSDRISVRGKLKLVLGSLSVLIIAGTLVATFVLAGKPKRDADLLHDVHLIGGHMGHGAILTADPVAWPTWSLQGYLMRYYEISVARPPGEGMAYCIVSEGQPVPEGWGKVALETKAFHLYAHHGDAKR